MEVRPVNEARAEEEGYGRGVPYCGTCGAWWGRAWAVAAVMGVGLTLRLAHIVATRQMPFVRHLVGDAAGYYQWAKAIAGGDWLGEAAFYQAPLYPYVLAVCFSVIGDDVWVVRVVQSLGSMVALWCLWYGTSRMFGRGAGLVAAIMLGAYGPAVFFDGVVQKASLACLLVCGLYAGMTWWEGVRRWRAALAVGVLAGLMAVTRENALVWLPILLVWVGTSWLRNGWRCAQWGIVAYALGVGLVLVPVGVRNKVVGGEWSVSTFQAGPNFYIGNHAGGNGRYQPLVRGHETPAFERGDATMLAERETGRKLSAREVSRYWMRRAMKDIEADPGAWARLMARKMLMVWNRYEVSDVESQYVYADYSPTLRLLDSVWNFGLLCPLAALGVVVTWREWRRLWVYYALIASMAVAVALFYVLARYRYPLVPLLIPFAAAGCVGVWSEIRARSWGRLAWQLAVVLMVAGVVNWPVHDEKRLNAMAWMNVGVALAEEGDLPGATRYFHRAVKGNPGSAEANNNLAQALALQGAYAEAVTYYKWALKADPALPGGEYNLAVALERVGRTEEALMHYERAVELDPSDAEARSAVERLRQWER